MAGSRQNKKLFLIAACIFGVAFYGWMKLLFVINSYDLRPKPIPLYQLETFSCVVDHNHLWYKKTCLGLTPDENLSIGKLEDIIGRWSIVLQKDCREVYQKLTNIYDINRRSGQVIIPDTFQTKVLKWLNNDDELFKEVKLQFITSIFNTYTHESSIFNPLRSKRPGVMSMDDDVREYVEELEKKSEKDCDFCAYQYKTAEDTFGRIESDYSATASNTFKYDGYHALIILKSHSPLNYNEIQFLDMMNTAMKWFMKVYETDKNYKYPHLMWDNLPKASASQVHPHAQASVGPVRHYGLMEHIRLTGIDYSREHGSNYFSDLLQIHTALGLTTTLGNATAMAYLTPKKDYEVIIMDKTASTDFFRLLYYTIKAFMDDLQLFAWSFAMFLPKLEPYVSPDYDDIPAIVRIISRGQANSPRNDISAMELFAVSNVNIDPFSVIGHVERSVAKHRKELEALHDKEEEDEQKEQPKADENNVDKNKQSENGEVNLKENDEIQNKQ
ncbi:uncharacterized protein LOC144442865 [Glandiceps talaboti]